MTWAIVVAAAVLAIVVVLYNRLVSARNRVDEGWAQIDVQLQRRHDLIPNLVDTVRAYATHERELFAHVAEARAAAVGAQGPRQQAAAEAQLDTAVRSLFAVSEAYPDLRASTNFLELQRELTTTEDRVAYSRQFYNSAVRTYDTRRQTFPTNLVAGLFGFDDREYYEVGDDARDVPTVGV